MGSQFDEVMKAEHLNAEHPKQQLRAALAEMDKEYICDTGYILEKLGNVARRIEQLRARHGVLMDG